MGTPNPLFLSRLSLNLANKVARQALADVYQAHLILSGGFGVLRPSEDRVLWRWEKTREIHPVLLIQSTVEPNWERLPADMLTSPPLVKDIRKLAHVLGEGQRLAFALTANASRKIDTKSKQGVRQNGRRVPLRRFDDQVEWLEQRAGRAGFDLMVNSLGRPDVRVGAPVRQIGRRGEQTITVESVRFEGALVVRDPERFGEALRSGIGPARAFGCGLLTVAPLT